MNLNRIQTARAASNRTHLPPAFTLVELLVMLLMIALLGLTLVPGAAKLRPNTKAIQCQNNLRQLTLAWHLYSADYNDRVANNYGVAETEATISSGTFANWVNNVMTWGASGSAHDRSNTNKAWVANGVLGQLHLRRGRLLQMPGGQFPQPRTEGRRLPVSQPQSFR